MFPIQRLSVFFKRSGLFLGSILSLTLSSTFAGSTYGQELATQKAAESSATGIVKTEPVDGRSAKSSTGYLVAYEQIIPGSEVKFKMLPIPGGTASIGSPESEADRNEDEGPVFQVEVAPFWLGKYEITWAEYKEFMKLCDVFDKFNDLGIRQVTKENEVDAVTAPSKLYESSFTYQSGEDPELPAVSMSQYAAKQYTKWLSLLTGDFYRLPTEAEWEYACRAGTSTAFSFGDDASKIGEYAWYTDNSDWETHFVGEKKPNPWGLYDMHGNAAEWVLDEYDAAHYASFTGRLTLAVDAVRWPTVLFPRVLRGGSWDDEVPACRSASRGQSDDDEWRSYDPNSPQSPWWFASDESQGVGFRIVRPSVVPPREEWAKYWDADLEDIDYVTNRRIEEEGRGERGIVDPSLPEAIKQLQK